MYVHLIKYVHTYVPTFILSYIISYITDNALLVQIILCHHAMSYHTKKGVLIGIVIQDSLFSLVV